MRRFLLIACLAALAACQTVPHKPGFSAAQVAALQQAGFKQVGENYELGIAERFLFDVNQSDVPPENTGVLSQLAKVLLGVGVRGVTVEGHTDSTGSAEYNKQLSERRAISVKTVLVGAGMNEPAVKPLGMGEADPVEDNATPEGRAQNRRVVIIVTPLDASAN